MDLLAAIPVKPFGVAKTRLAPLLTPTERTRLGRAITLHTAQAAADVGAQVVILTGDEGVAGWARARGLQTLDEGEHSRGLDGAAAAAAAHSQNLGVRWAIVHADLPLVSPADLHAVFTTEGPAIAPSHDGGTNVLVGNGADFTFSYGPASFHRHLACRPGATVVTRPGLALDLDTPRDFRRALRSRSGAWLTDLVSAS